MKDEMTVYLLNATWERFCPLFGSRAYLPSLPGSPCFSFHARSIILQIQGDLPTITRTSSLSQNYSCLFREGAPESTSR
jgi:hypothetical protein